MNMEILPLTSFSLSATSFPLYDPPFIVGPIPTDPVGKSFEILCPLPLDSIYACAFVEEEGGYEVLLSDSICDGTRICLYLDDIPNDAKVQILGLQGPLDQVVAEYEGIVGDLQIADRIQLELVINPSASG